jgi:hypothetical protein
MISLEDIKYNFNVLVYFDDLFYISKNHQKRKKIS